MVLISLTYAYNNFNVDGYFFLSLGVENGILQAYNMDFELQFSHRVNQISRFSQADMDACTFLYLLKDDGENLLYCYLFQAQRVKDVTDLYKQMKEQSHVTPTRSLSSAATLTSLCVDISPSSSNFFEVLYIGKIKVWQKKVPDTFIDDALERFRIHELEKNKFKHIAAIGRLQSEDNILRKGFGDSSGVNKESSNNSSRASTPTHQLQRSVSHHSNILQKDVNTKVEDKDVDSSKLTVLGRITDVKEENESKDDKVPGPSTSNEKSPEPGELSAHDELKSSVDMDDYNRTMVLQVDRTDLRLISPDRKVILLHKQHRDVTTCVQGLIKSEHFGFICKEMSPAMQTFTGYIFKCESSSIATDAVAAITQAFLNTEQKARPPITSCDHCPMVWFHKLCTEIEHMSDKKTQAAILRRLEQLESDEQMTILAKFRGAETDSMREQNEFLMMLLRAHCEMKQGRHIHDTAENRTEFLNQYLGIAGTSVFTKAKKSLTNSFDQFLKRKASHHDFSTNMKNMTLPITNNLNKDSSPSATAPISESSTSDKDSESFRSRSSTIESQHEGKDHYLQVRNNKHSSVSPDRSTVGSDKGLKSPMLDIFMKVGNSPKVSHGDDDSVNKVDATSWRQAIFKRVVSVKNDKTDGPTKQKSKEELRELWKKAIKQAILLVRMEKENARIQAKQEESAVKRIKLEYDEMKPNQREVMEVWDMITNKEAHIKCDKPMLLQAIRQGVPRGKRGEVWQFLAEQHCLKSAPPDAHKYPNYNIPYEKLLKQLTSHQHAILIDLGRTFPNHSYFSSPLGPGQLALFNLLKAYSLLDPEVGYCQGLSFVAGVLLLHMEESQAFTLLRHLMFRRGLRVQYLPDMIGLQVKLYQLSRLLHDQIPELYNHFDLYEVAPTLYAAPWVLTVFASQFPLGFVTRVFDLVFLEGPNVIFRVALALLNFHKDKILLCDSFEEIMNYMKGPLASVDKPILDKVMKQVYTTDISKQLEEYKVEYNVLQEEMYSVQPQVEALHKLEAQNKTLTEQNKALMGQLELALSNVQRLEKTRVIQQGQLNRLEMQSRGLDVTVATLANFINNLIEEKVDVEIPSEVRRIMSQISLSEKVRNEGVGQMNLIKILQEKEHQMLPPERVMVKSLSTGKIALPTNIDQVPRSNSLNTNAQNILTPQLKKQVQGSPGGSTEKKSNFFSNSHSNILEQQRLHNSQNSLLNSRIDIKIQEFENNRRISEAEPVDQEKVSPTHSIDSGVGTPSSPKMPEHHPLSSSEVNFTFSGTKELKSLKSLKHYQRNSSPEMMGNSKS
ncbi:PTB_TBC1D1_like and TBC domain-containing protein plx isoform X2 [Rhynchophorus ferrugineus]|uniref:PTB_TBC1D1_like and TBC domain-containing protein plx isoform X2 n=1 Tax=Rhynchophorus ferrugineus TaxID=354439 RepID=UPI003FCC9FA6